MHVRYKEAFRAFVVKSYHLSKSTLCSECIYCQHESFERLVKTTMRRHLDSRKEILISGKMHHSILSSNRRKLCAHIVRVEKEPQVTSRPTFSGRRNAEREHIVANQAPPHVQVNNASTTESVVKSICKIVGCFTMPLDPSLSTNEALCDLTSNECHVEPYKCSRATR